MMSALDNGSNPSESSSDLRLAASLTTTNLQGQEIDSKKSTKLYRRMRIYTRSQLLFLNDSPLVHPPPNMPDLKQWFGCVVVIFASCHYLLSPKGPKMRQISTRRRQSSQHQAVLENDGDYQLNKMVLQILIVSLKGTRKET